MLMKEQTSYTLCITRETMFKTHHIKYLTSNTTERKAISEQQVKINANLTSLMDKILQQI